MSQNQKPIERLIFSSFLEDDSETIQISSVIQKLLKMGFLEDDPRLSRVIHDLKSFRSKVMNYEDFKQCINKHICIFRKILKHELIIPDFESFSENIESIYDLLYINNMFVIYVFQSEAISKSQRSNISQRYCPRKQKRYF